MPALPGIVGFVTMLTVYAPCGPPSAICNPLIAEKYLLFGSVGC
jgi:hypothetical protein